MGFEMEIEEGIADVPERIAVLGEAGIGKTSFAAAAPYPFFIDVENGSKRFKHIARNKKRIEDWETVYASVEWLRTAKHSYKTVVLDTLDQTESYCWNFLCRQDGVNSIEQVNKGFGKGYIAAHEQFRMLFSAMDKLSEERGMHIIILAHQKAEKISNPIGSDYHRFSFKVHQAVGGLMYQWCDHVLFAMRDTIVTDEVFDEARPRAIGGTKRQIRTTAAPGYVAKVRTGTGPRIPDPIPLSWHDWVCYLANSGFPRLLRETVQDNARRLGDVDTFKKIADMIAGNADVMTLAKANAKLLKLLGTSYDPPAEDPQQNQQQAGAPPKDGEQQKSAQS